MWRIILFHARIIAFLRCSLNISQVRYGKNFIEHYRIVYSVNIYIYVNFTQSFYALWSALSTESCYFTGILQYWIVFIGFLHAKDIGNSLSAKESTKRWSLYKYIIMKKNCSMIDKMEVGTVESYTKVRKLDNNENTRMPMWLWKRIERNRYIGAKVRWGEIKLR